MLISEYVKQHTKEQVKFRDGELWLEKCPICGGEAKLYIASRLDPPCHYTVAFVRCTKCRIRTDDIIVDGYDGSTDIVNDAIGYWNDRPVEPRVKRIYIYKRSSNDDFACLLIEKPIELRLYRLITESC